MQLVTNEGNQSETIAPKKPNEISPFILLSPCSDRQHMLEDDGYLRHVKSYEMQVSDPSAAPLLISKHNPTKPYQYRQVGHGGF